MTRVLLIAPTYMNLYEDIAVGLRAKGYIVQYYPDKRIPGDPFNNTIGDDDKLPVNVFIPLLDTMWSDIMDNDPYGGYYDYLLVIDGLSVSPSLFDILRKSNPDIITCNYLYDRIKGVYDLTRNFPYYDKVFSFDHNDCVDYNLSFLPIYWPQIDPCKSILYDVFGFGAYDAIRLDVFKQVKDIVSRAHLSFFIQIYSCYDHILSFVLKNSLNYVLGRKHLSLTDILSGIYTNKPIQPSVFRELISSSNVILDTNRPYQDGLTARFMWALGAKKKIITTNASVRDYAFYSQEQFFIIDDNWQDLISFINTPYSMPDFIEFEVEKYRIDNWLDTILKR